MEGSNESLRPPGSAEPFALRWVAPSGAGLKLVQVIGELSHKLLTNHRLVASEVNAFETCLERNEGLCGPGIAK